ncbi:hypothetical protein BpHYR1_026174 [Brachionus plicatilis]|uniref:Uncharacterized protein n=1 Tax=Brachionus plicatilis TaxID=10195 RepID=A0A3M7QR17_BRAPC|nr:hypothetical protein BpHYR1_026174 [Brachionus plicatilis]
MNLPAIIIVTPYKWLLITVFPRSILQPQNQKPNFDAGNKQHLARVKTFLTYTACVKVVFLVLAQVDKKFKIEKKNMS